MGALIQTKYVDYYNEKLKSLRFQTVVHPLLLHKVKSRDI